MTKNVILNLSGHVGNEKAPGDSKTLLLEVITAQEDLMQVQKEAILSLLNETVEQESIINELLCRNCE